MEKWRDEKLAAQADTPLSEMPKLTVSMINSKVLQIHFKCRLIAVTFGNSKLIIMVVSIQIGDLESEVQYLIRKAKMKKAELERAR